MRRFMAMATLMFFVAGARLPAAGTPQPAIEFRDGDRVALLGGTLVEREQRYGYWEHAITAAYPDRRLTFRNLGWSGDTVWAESRGIFDPAEQGYARLIQQVRELRPTLFLLNYGGNEAWESLQRGQPADAAIESFIAQYGKLIDDLTAASHGQPAAPDQPAPAAAVETRFVLLTPLPLAAGVGPNHHPERYNEHLAKYAAAIEKLASGRGFATVDLAGLYAGSASEASGAKAPPLSDNGVHLSEYGYWRTAPWIRDRLCAGTVAAALTPATDDVAKLQDRLNSQTGAIKGNVVPDNQLKNDAACLEFGGRLTVLPQPVLGTQSGDGPHQKFDLPTPGAYRLEADGVSVASGSAADWGAGVALAGGPDADRSRELLVRIRRKNELYFHRWRPQNVTYLFLFRKHEQGNNAVEIPQFDPLIAAEEQQIADLTAPQPHRVRLIRIGDQ